MKLSATRKALILANIFNSLVAIYFIIIAIVGLVQLRWYHQLTITVKVRHIITLTTSYFAFIILIVVGLVLLGLFIGSALKLTKRNENASLNPIRSSFEDQDQNNAAQNNFERRQTKIADESDDVQMVDLDGEPSNAATSLHQSQRVHSPSSRLANGRMLMLRDTSISEDTNTTICCSILLHLIATIGLILILLIWLFNTGELVRDSISTQLDYALARYQFTNRSNHYSIAIDGMQDINNCCGSLDFTDFPHQRVSGLSSGHYPGSCCGKHIFGVNARVLCTADEIWRAKQTSGCTTVLAGYYDLVSLLVVPVALICLFVNITIIALITVSKRGNISIGHHTSHGQLMSQSSGNNSTSAYQGRAQTNLRKARRLNQNQHQQQPQHHQMQPHLSTGINAAELADNRPIIPNQ